MINILISGVLRGGMYMLIALGLALVYGVMGIPNFAHGEYYLFGAYATYFAVTYLHLSPIIAIFLGALFGFVMGCLIEKVTFSPLRKRNTGDWVMNAFMIGAGIQLIIQNGVQYMLPVTISNVDGTDFRVLESSRTIYIRLARTITFHALSMDNISLYSEFLFPDEKAIELPQYTYEIKCYPTNLKSDGAEQICRLCNFTGPLTGARQNMLRFNENGRPWRSLQIVTPSGGDYTTTTIFEENQWYMLSMVYDGSTYQLYINGEPDATTLTGDQSTVFQRIELGMSWTSYGGSQNFNGRICEMRVWDYPRSKSQIQGALCGTDPQSEGLRAYWKFNQSSGTTFKDETGHGYDMDWTQSIKEFTDGGGYQPNPSAAGAINWVKDNKNTCSE